MSFNSSFADAPLLSSNSSLSSVDCTTFGKSILILTAFSITNILLILPLSTLILYLGFQHRRQRSKISTTRANTNHSVFTYQMAVMELVGVLACLLFCVGVNINCPGMFTYSYYMLFSTLCVKIHFHTLTSMERYLAVVHPVTYMILKKPRPIMIKNIFITCIWLLCFGCVILISQTQITVVMDMYLLFTVFALIVVCFCCISVLRVLRRPRPGEVGRDRERVDQMKQRAFNTVVSIMGALWLCLGGMLVCNALLESQILSPIDQCVVQASAIWFSLPSSLVLPLLYLHRAGKLPGCKH